MVGTAIVLAAAVPGNATVEDPCIFPCCTTKIRPQKKLWQKNNTNNFFGIQIQIISLNLILVTLKFGRII